MSKEKPKDLRLTFVLNGRLNQRLRQLHAEAIENSDHSVSFSAILNQILAEGLKKK